MKPSEEKIMQSRRNQRLCCSLISTINHTIALFFFNNRKFQMFVPCFTSSSNLLFFIISYHPIADISTLLLNHSYLAWETFNWVRDVYEIDQISKNQTKRLNFKKSGCEKHDDNKPQIKSYK